MPRTFRPGTLSVQDAAYLTSLARRMDRWDKLTVQPPLRKFEAAGNVVIGGSASLGGSGDGFLAQITASTLGPPLTYRIEEVENDPDDIGEKRAKAGGRKGPFVRWPTVAVESPPLGVGQEVWVTPSATLELGDVSNAVSGDTGVYDGAPNNSYFRATLRLVTKTTGGSFPNPADCDSFGVAILEDSVLVSFSGDGICLAYSPAGEGES